MLYRGIPVFIDSRVEVYVKEFNGKETIFTDCYDINPEELINKYNFDYYIVTKGSDMYEYLNSNKYELLFDSYNYYYLYKNKEV